MWVASTDYTKDMLFGPKQVASSSDMLRRVRNSVRFLLGNLRDFDFEAHPLGPIDAYFLKQTHDFVKEAELAYEARDFRLVYTQLASFLSSISTTYFDFVKDTLYCDEEDGQARRAAQYVLWYQLQALTLVLAPIAPFTAEDIHLHVLKDLNVGFQGYKPEECASVFTCDSYDRSGFTMDPHLKDLVEDLLKKRKAFFSMAAKQGFNKTEGLKVTVQGSSNVLLEQAWVADLFHCAEVLVDADGEEGGLVIEESEQSKCARCRRVAAIQGELCGRCESMNEVVEEEEQEGLIDHEEEPPKSKKKNKTKKRFLLSKAQMWTDEERAIKKNIRKKRRAEEKKKREEKL